MSYRQKYKKPTKINFDLIVIGTGAAGNTAALLAAKHGKKVAVVEKEELGGVHTRTGIIPTKAFVHAAEIHSVLHHAHEIGIINQTIKPDFTLIKKYMQRVIRNTDQNTVAASFKAVGIHVLHGNAHFISPWELSVAGERYTAHNFLIATGSHDYLPPIKGLPEAGYLKPQLLSELSSLPKKVCVIGGGTLGVETAHALSVLGCSVLLLESAARLLPYEDTELSAFVEAQLEKSNVTVRTTANIDLIESKGKHKIISYKHLATSNQVTVDTIILATGKKPSVDLGLENAHVAFTEDKGIHVNNHMQASAPHIYAAGDVTGGSMYANASAHQGRIAGLNMLSPLKHIADFRAVPRVIFIALDCASVGVTEQQLKDKHLRYQVAFLQINNQSSAVIDQQTAGFIKILADKKGRILGATIVAPHAREMIHELTLAIQWRLKASKLDFTMHVDPSWSQAIQQCASKIICR